MKPPGGLPALGTDGWLRCTVCKVLRLVLTTRAWTAETYICRQCRGLKEGEYDA